MVALTISLIILTGVAAIFATSRATYQTDEGLARLQENARFALDYMNKEIRMAGYFGCFRDPTRVLITDTSKVYSNLTLVGTIPGGFPNNFAMPIEGFEANGTGTGATYAISSSNPDPAGVALNNWTPSLDATLQNRVLPGTDVVVIRRALESGAVRLVPPTYSDTTLLYVDPSAPFQNGEILIATDCSKASVFQASNRAANGPTIGHDAGNVCKIWGSPSAGSCPPDAQQYRDGAELTRGTATAFFVGRGTSGSPALFMTTTSGLGFNFLEIVEGVENMQILYGVDTTPPPAPLDYANQYMTAAQVNALTAADALTGWPRVMSVRVNLLIRTTNTSTTGQADQITDTGTYNVGGTTIDPANDKRRRRVFTTTIQLRNRLPG